MNLLGVMVEIGQVLGGMDSVTPYVGAPARVDPPDLGAAVIVPLPEEIVYDGTYGRGMDTITQPILFLLPRPTELATHQRIAKYADGAGADSVKAVLEGASWTTCDGVRVGRGVFDAVSYAGVKYLAVEFDVEIWGSGKV